MSIRKYVDDRYLVPSGRYLGRIHAVSQKCKDGRSWTVIAVEIADGFFQSRLVFDIIRRSGFSKEAVQHDRDREASLVALGGKKRKYTRACRGLVGRLVEIEVVERWRSDLGCTANGIRSYRRTDQFLP